MLARLATGGQHAASTITTPLLTSFHQKDICVFAIWVCNDVEHTYAVAPCTAVPTRPRVQHCLVSSRIYFVLFHQRQEDCWVTEAPLKLPALLRPGSLQKAFLSMARQECQRTWAQSQLLHQRNARVVAQCTAS